MVHSDDFVRLIVHRLPLEFNVLCSQTDVSDIDFRNGSSLIKTLDDPEIEQSYRSMFTMLFESDPGLYAATSQEFRRLLDPENIREQYVTFAKLTFTLFGLFRGIPMPEDQKRLFATFPMLYRPFGKRFADLGIDEMQFVTRLVEFGFPGSFSMFTTIVHPEDYSSENTLEIIRAAFRRADTTGLKFLLTVGFDIAPIPLLRFALNTLDLVFLKFLLEKVLRVSPMAADQVPRGKKKTRKMRALFANMLREAGDTSVPGGHDMFLGTGDGDHAYCSHGEDAADCPLFNE